MATSTATGSITTPADFARAVLASLGVPATQDNIDVMVAWEAQEGGHWNNTRRYNPLNTTLPEPGSSPGGSQGNIMAYTSWSQGVQATVSTLSAKAHGYPAIIAALMQGNNPQGVAQAIVNSDWGTKTVNLSNKVYHPTSAKSDGGAGGIPGNSANYDATAPTPPKDWIQTLEGLLNPNFGWNPFGDVKDAIGLAVTRGGIVFVGLVLIGGGVLLAFGRDIFSAAAVVSDPAAGAAAFASTTTPAARRTVSRAVNRPQQGAAA